MKSVKDLKEDLNSVRTNPAAIQRIQVDTIQAMGNGDYGVVDPSNPFTYLLECAAIGASVGIDRAETLMRRQYPGLAQNYNDLYHHMSDVDFANRFATPSRVNLTFLIGLDDVKQSAIDVEGRYKKVTIPKDTEVLVDGMPLTLNYPIDIRVMPHGGVRVVYDTTNPNPLETLTSNIIEHKIIRMDPSAGTGIDGKLIQFDIPMHQFRIRTYYDQLNESSGFKKTYSFENQFYYCRAYVASGSKDEWTEIKTTHSDQVYDPTQPTALLRVADDQLEVSIPQVYFTRGLLGKGIRIDVYTTRGEVTQSLELYQPRNFVAKWRDLSRIENPYTVPIQSIGTFTIFSTDRTRGGRNGLTFKEMRQRVISNSMGNIDIPITPAQITAALDNMGYSIVKDVDNITNRTYLATRELPSPSSDAVVSTAMGCTIKTLQSTFEKLSLVGGVYDNGPRITLPSGSLFKLNQGLLDAVDQSELATLNQASPESKATLLQSNDYAYIPFHYVLDSIDNTFEARAYYLDKPGIMTKEFVSENETTQLEVMTFRYGISKRSDGYRLVVTTRSGSVFRSMSGDRVTAQLSYTPPGEVEPAYMNGTYLGRQEGTDEHMFEFMLTSDYDLDNDDNLLLTSFFMYDDSPRSVASPLRNKFDITYIVNDHYVDDMETSNMDSTKGVFLLEGDNIAVARERLDIHFGEPLSNLWSRARSVAGSIEYKTYQDDVFETHESDVYERNPDGSLKLTQGPDGIEYTKLHSAGDVVLDGDDQPVVKHRKGDVMLDTYGDPIPKSGRRVTREVDLLLFEGVFNYVNDVSALDYAGASTETIVGWVVDDIIEVQDRLLENTQMWFYPKATMGDVDVVVENGVRTAVSAAQSLKVKFYMTREGHENIPLREDLKQTAKVQISNYIGSRTVSVVEMARIIKDSVGEDVLDVVVSGLGGFDNNYEMLSLREDSESLGINKRPIVLPNNTLTVEDDITIEYVRHREN